MILFNASFNKYFLNTKRIFNKGLNSKSLSILKWEPIPFVHLVLKKKNNIPIECTSQTETKFSLL